MTNWIGDRMSRRAVWSHRLARFAVPVLLVTALAHRFALIDTPTALTLLAIIWAGSTVALLLGLSAMRAIWRLGIAGTGRAFAGIVTTLPILAVPLFFAGLLLRTPVLNDVTTDPADPPQFAAAASLRDSLANAVAYPGALAAERQLQAYPELRPFRLAMPAGEAFPIVAEVARDQGWRVIASEAPSGPEAGRIEAVASTLLMAFRDDVAIRVAPDGEGSRIDIRSASRYGSRDFGTNASRIRSFLFALRERAAPTAGGER